MLLDTAVCTENLGDFIIMDAVREQINEIFPNAMVLHTATHEKISQPTYHMAKQSDFSFVGGTNLISSNMNIYNQWKINLIDSLYLKNIILMGVGWWQYQKDANFYTRYLLKSVLSHDLFHSVRDSYAEIMLKKAGFNNVINTSCPTMWRLTEEHCKSIPRGKAESVVATLTDYNKNTNQDFAMIKLLSECYSKVYIWPQGSWDFDYICQLGLSKYAEILPPKLETYNAILQTDKAIDFVGTRLHAGIRALQNKRRTIIIGIDNRAIEKAKDFNIIVCPRDDMNKLRKLINSDFDTRVNLPMSNIDRWKNQFK
jgi:polysaccharide pyruvyl transferase WcaK-like protein